MTDPIPAQDMTKPVTPKNAYMLWLTDKQQELKQKYPNLKGDEFMKKVCSEWNAEVDKSQWIARAAAAKATYMEAMQRYNAAMKKPVAAHSSAATQAVPSSIVPARKPDMPNDNAGASASQPAGNQGQPDGTPAAPNSEQAPCSSCQANATAQKRKRKTTASASKRKGKKSASKATAAKRRKKSKTGERRCKSKPASVDKKRRKNKSGERRRSKKAAGTEKRRKKKAAPQRRRKSKSA